MNPPRRREAPKGPSPADKQAAAKQPDNASLSEIAVAYLVIVVSPYGQPRRRPYLSLHHATQAVQRAHAKGQSAHMALCQLVPVTGDLGEWPA